MRTAARMLKLNDASMPWTKAGRIPGQDLLHCWRGGCFAAKLKAIVAVV